MYGQVFFDEALLKKYDVNAPRYTSYPAVPHFKERFTTSSYIENVVETNGQFIPRPLSLYLHIPFCDSICYYCACNKVITKDHGRAESYLDYLMREISLQSALFDKDRIVEQMHWGGGTPTFIDDQQIVVLMEHLHKSFNFAKDDEGEFSIEIDPRAVETDTIGLLRGVGFNRLSIGIQDLDKRVQRAVNREQTERETFMIMEAAREYGFNSISVDLMYGLPHQTTTSFRDTLERVISAEPDRISLFNYAHMPEIFKPQRRINVEDLPSPEMKLAILKTSIEYLLSAGYVYIGMDHFARPYDELASAQQEGRLHRNFQGYSTHSGCDLVAMGLTAIGKIGDNYNQNYRELDSYYAAIDDGQLPIYKGLKLSLDDKIRQTVIQTLICQFELDFSAVEKLYDIKFFEYFSKEKSKLEEMAEDGLLSLSDSNIQVRPEGRLLIRNICTVFDAYLNSNKQQYSKAI